MATLGKIEKIEDLRTIWPKEEQDFSKWLAQDENLALLSDTIGVDIVLTDTESPVGAFSVDIFASEEGTGRKIVIENQLEDTNHDHLGKIITYAAGKGAEVVIWIVKRARDEHKQAVEWLNSHTDENIGFFLLEVELWKIGDSLPAPKFNVVERPNDWAKTMKATSGLSDLQVQQLNYWTAFNNYAFTKPEFAKAFTQRKAGAQHWYDLSLGSSVYHVGLTANSQKKLIGTEIYINNNKEQFEKFKAHKDAIETELGMPLTWREASKDSRILAQHTGDFKGNEDQWNGFFDWYCEMALKFKCIAAKYEK